jgi:hypothetical protein
MALDIYGFDITSTFQGHGHYHWRNWDEQYLSIYIPLATAKAVARSFYRTVRLLYEETLVSSLGKTREGASGMIE